jgi:ABC-2 type transport system permease protein
MPDWLKTLSRLNPLIYVLDAMRTFMLASRTSTFGPSYHYAIILLTSTIFAFISARLYPRLAS